MRIFIMIMRVAEVNILVQSYRPAYTDVDDVRMPKALELTEYESQSTHL